MAEEISGACCRLNTEQIMFINARHSKGRQNFTAAHEIYHLFYEESSFTICNIKSNDEVEKNANKFASFLLMPINALYNYKKENKIKKWDLNSIIDCEQYFQISHRAMLCKLRREDMITYDDYLRYKSGVKSAALDLGYDLSLYESTKEYYSLGKIIPLSKLAYYNKKNFRRKA